MTLDFQITDEFEGVIDSSASIMVGFRYRFGRNINGQSITGMDHSDMEADVLSIVYVAETSESEGEFEICIDPLEELHSKNYEVLYLLYDDLVTETFDRLAATIDITGNVLSESKNFIKLDLDVTCQVKLLGHGHVLSNDIPTSIVSSNNSSHKNKLSYDGLLEDRKSSNNPFPGSITITNFGIKLT